MGASTTIVPRKNGNISVFLVFLVLVWGIWVTATAFLELRATPWTGLHIFEAHGRAEVHQMVPGSPADLAGVRVGDVLVAVGGRAVDGVAFVKDRDYLPSWEAERRFWIESASLERNVRVGQPIALTFLRDGTSCTHLVVPEVYPWEQLLRRLSPLVITGWVALLLALLVATKVWSPAAKVNLAGCMAFCIALVCLAGFNARDLCLSQRVHFYFQITNEVASVFAALAFGHFGWIFPRRHPLLRRFPWLIGAVWSFGVLLLLGHYLHLLPSPIIGPNLGLLVGALSFAVGMLSGLMSVRSPVHRRQILWVVEGLLVSLGLPASLSFIPLIMGLPFVPEELGILPVVFFPLSVSISMLYRQNAVWGALLRKWLAIGVLVVPVFLLPEALALWVALRWSNAWDFLPLLLALGAMPAVLLYPKLLRWVHSRVVGGALHPEPGADVLIEHFLYLHAQGMVVERALEQTLSDYLKLPFLVGGEPGGIHSWFAEHREELNDFLEESSRPVSGGEISDAMDLSVPAEIEASVFVPLFTSSQGLVRVFVLGPRWSPDGWAKGDMERLGALSAIASPLADVEEKRHHDEEVRRERLESDKRLLESRVEERTRELEDANRHLSHALKAREDFLAAMSHELRTPLSTLLGSVEALQAEIDGPLTGSMRSRLAAMERNGKHLRELIGDVLDFARGRAGKLTARKAPFAVAEICTQAVELAGSRDGAVAADVHVSPISTTLAALGDPLRVRQILTNLLANALAYGAGRRSLVVERSQDEVLFRMLDEGEGIPPEKIASLFQAFERFHAGPGGTGLGLALSYQLAGLMDGRLEYLRRSEGGCEFRLSLPWCPEPPHASAKEAVSQALLTEHPHLMLVEDHPDLRMLLQDYLEAKGWVIQAFRSAEAALTAAHEAMPSLVLTDLGLPGMNGLDLVRSLRALPGSARLRIVVLTGQVMPEDSDLCADAGADLMLSKPIQLPQLDLELRRLALSVQGA